MTLQIPEGTVSVKPVAVNVTLTVGFEDEEGNVVGLVPLNIEAAACYPFGESVENIVRQVLEQLRGQIEKEST